MCAVRRWQRPAAGVRGERSHAAALLRGACSMLLKTPAESVAAMTLTLPTDELTSGQLMDMALDMAAANGLIAEVGDAANHVGVRLTRQYRAIKGGSR